MARKRPGPTRSYETAGARNYIDNGTYPEAPDPAPGGPKAKGLRAQGTKTEGAGAPRLKA
eukprot:692845-Alexandrium_andersonii.AAC.1